MGVVRGNTLVSDVTAVGPCDMSHHAVTSCMMANFENQGDGRKLLSMMLAEGDPVNAAQASLQAGL